MHSIQLNLANLAASFNIDNENIAIHWTSITSSPNFFQKKLGVFYTIKSVGISNDCMLSFTF